MQTQIPLFQTESNWRPPNRLESFSHARRLGVDVETRDPNLDELGPGYTRGDGYIVGISISDGDKSVYWPIRHEGGDNLDEGMVLSHVREVLSHDREYIYANATYDLGWLSYHGIQCNGTIRDVQVAECLLDETRMHYNLDVLAHDYLGIGKDELLLEQATDNYQLANQRRGKKGNKAFHKKRDLWRLPARYVGPYAEADAERTVKIYNKQEPLLHEENLWEVWELECRITPICHYMTMTGVAVDLKRANEINDKLKIKQKQLEKECKGINVWAVDDCVRLLQSYGIETPKTSKGNPSCPKSFLEDLKHPIGSKLIELRQLDRLRGPFLERNILQNNINGRIHAQFLQTNREEGGTRSGRFSSQLPNMQQVPKRSAIGKLLRSLYLAEEDHLWCKCDYSSQEPRLQVHYALLMDIQGATRAKEFIEAGKKLYDLITEATDCSYAQAKDLLLGLSYGMGLRRLADSLGYTIPDAQREILDPLRERCPFIFELAEIAKKRADTHGVIKTILGRKARFDWWAPDLPPKMWDQREDYPAVKGFDKAQELYKGWKLQRAFLNKALNCLIQGSAADQTKKAMVLMWDAGLKMNLPVHDEINRSNCRNEAEARLQVEIMEQAIQLKIKTVADLDLGQTWC